VAQRKPATQSSLSPYSTKLGAGEAVSGTIPSNYAIHTLLETNPWWMVDLGFDYPIDRIVIHNRLEGFHERAKDCRVEISKDGTEWLLIHAGRVHFLGGTKGPPLVLPLERKEAGRYVKISLPGKEVLHLAQVEVFADPAAKIREKYKLKTMTFGGAFKIRAHPAHMLYVVEGNESDDVELIGLRLTPIGRLGNQMLQIINAVAMARRHHIRYVEIVNGGLINLRENIEHDGIVFLPTGAPQPEPGAFLTGSFFFRNELSPLLDRVPRSESYQIIQEIVAPRFMEKLPLEGDEKYRDELTIHFRAGDIFADPSSAAGYTQPPVAFYTLLVRHCMDQGDVKRVRLVFENRGNPCIEALIKFLEAKEIPHRTQSGTLPEDLAALVDSRFLVFGFGSFGLAVVMMSKYTEKVFCFEGLGEAGYIGIPSIGKVVLVRDKGKKYIKPGQWQNTPAQIQLMLDYPEENLEIVAGK
jgi:hypothetical protein